MTHQKPKTKYRLRNWSEYNRALVARGSLTRWITEDVVQTWHVSEAEPQRGHPRTYTDTAILRMATLQEVYHLGVRQTQGLMESIGAVLHLAVAIPDYSTLSRCRATLEVGGAAHAHEGSAARGRGQHGRQSVWRRRGESTPARLHLPAHVAQGTCRGGGSQWRGRGGGGHHEQLSR